MSGFKQCINLLSFVILKDDWLQVWKMGWKQANGIMGEIYWRAPRASERKWRLEQNDGHESSSSFA